MKRLKSLVKFDLFIVASPNQDDFDTYGMPGDPVLCGVIMDKPKLPHSIEERKATSATLALFRKPQVKDIENAAFFEIGWWDIETDINAI